MNDKKRLDEIIEFLTETHLDTEGGYLYDHCWIGDTLVIAGLDPGKENLRTSIDTYTRRSLIAWHKRAEKFAAEHSKESSEVCFWETYPNAE